MKVGDASDMRLLDLQYIGSGRWHIVWSDAPTHYYVSEFEANPEWDTDDRGQRYVHNVLIEPEWIAVCDAETDDEIGRLAKESLRYEARLIVMLQPKLRQAAEDAARDADPHGV